MPFFFFNDTATTEIYTLSLHDTLPIFQSRRVAREVIASLHLDQNEEFLVAAPPDATRPGAADKEGDRKSTRLNSSHVRISYAVFCLKKKSTTKQRTNQPLNQVKADRH